MSAALQRGDHCKEVNIILNVLTVRWDKKGRCREVADVAGLSVYNSLPITTILCIVYVQVDRNSLLICFKTFVYLQLNKLSLQSLSTSAETETEESLATLPRDELEGIDKETVMVIKKNTSFHHLIQVFQVILIN